MPIHIRMVLLGTTYLPTVVEFKMRQWLGKQDYDWTAIIVRTGRFLGLTTHKDIRSMVWITGEEPQLHGLNASEQLAYYISSQLHLHHATVI